MIYKEIPFIDRPVPTVIFGGAAISGEGGGYGFGKMSESEAETLLKAAWDNGITFFDTAPIYGFGLSEERLGKYLPPDAFVITKSGVDWHTSRRVNMTNDPAITEKMLHASLKRLKRDCIDLYMIHWPDSRVDIRRPLEVLVMARNAGKIKHIGLCNTNLEDLTKAAEVCSITSLQSELNLFNQSSFTELGSEWKNKFSMSWGTFDKGILSGRVDEKRQFEREDCRSWAPWWHKKEVLTKIERVHELKRILSDYEISLPDFCLQFNLRYIGVTSCLIGLKSVGDVVHVSSNLQQNLMRERIEEVLIRWGRASDPNNCS